MILYLIFGTFFLFIFYQIFLKEKFGFYLYGIINLKQSRFEKAIINLNKAIEQNQNSVKNHYYLGEAYRLLSEKKDKDSNVNKIKSVESYFKTIYYSKHNNNHKFLSLSLNHLKLIYYGFDNENKTKLLNTLFRFSQNLDKVTLISIYKNELSDLLSEYSKTNNFITNLFFEELEKPVIKYHELSSIKKFDFDELNSISFENLLKKLEINNIKFLIAKDKLGNDTKYIRHWEPEERFALIIEKELFEKTYQNNALTFDLKKVIKQSNSGYYTNLILSKHKTTDDYISEMLEENLKNYE